MKKSRDRKCENCANCIYSDYKQKYTCFMFVIEQAVNPNGVCENHVFKEEIIPD